MPRDGSWSDAFDNTSDTVIQKQAHGLWSQQT